ncbi:MAG: LamG-like jellyroll fold domain-containing protein, partial [Robiginitalea sp.]|nr:LamG-like jellyroll fold domain-containing protein [Robiginitalea sp.]
KGNALYFDGKDDYVEIYGQDLPVPQAVSGLRTGAISLWFRVDSIPRLHGIAPLFYYGGEEQCDFFDGANQGLILEVGHSPVHKRSERLYFTIFANGCTYPSFCFDSNQSIFKGRWYHLVVVVGEDYNTGYLDGVEMENRNYNFGGPGDSQFFDNALLHERLWLGRGHWDRTTQYLKGAIDELKIFYRPLSEDMVQALYLEGLEATPVEGPDAAEGSLTLWPNPADGVLKYETGQPAGTILSTVQVIDMNGKVVHTQSELPPSGSLDLSHLTAGLYQISFSGEQGLLSGKTILLR